ncbi:MAG: anhydro-N-acetylmuramic acid kinase [Clostridia bacterium]
MLNLFETNNKRLVVGLMSGTSVDGIDAALCEIFYENEKPQIKLIAFENSPFPTKVRELIFEVFDTQKATIDKVGALNVILGKLYAKSVISIAKKANKSLDEIDLIGSHGQTIFHHPNTEIIADTPVTYTVQIGEGAVIAAKTGIPTVSDFRVADMAYGGQGAPVVPFTEQLLYSRKNETILLQNIGGIGNITVLPASATSNEVFAFDTGPGNMIIDAVISKITNGEKTFDKNGDFASTGSVCHLLLDYLKQDEYYTKALPKTTGREDFGVQYTEKILQLQKAHNISDKDLIATITDLTAWSIENAYKNYILPKHKASELIVGGGGSYNSTLMKFLSKRFEKLGVKVSIQENLGFNSDAKEAVAFALLADCCASGKANVLTSVTGANKPAIMGKISLPSNVIAT